MKSIAILHYSCPPVVGGVEEIVQQQASLFHRYRHPVKVMFGIGSFYTDDYKIEINPLLSSRNSLILDLQRDPELNRKKINEVSNQIGNYFEKALKDFEILIAHNVLSMPYNLPLTLALHRLADRGQMKVISWNHDSPFFYRKFPRELKGPAWRILRKYNPRLHYVTISPSRAREFRRLYRKKVDLEVIPDGIDPIQLFHLDKMALRFIREQNLFLSDLILVQPSRLHPRKNIELSIQVLRAFHDLGVQAKLLLTGAYDPHEKRTLNYYHTIKNLAQALRVDQDLIVIPEYHFESGDKVIMRDLYHISDLLFLPSREEGFGIPLLEAGMIKLPIACSDIEPFKTVGGENVLYFSLKDRPEEIARNILQFLSGLKPHQMYRNVIRHYVWDNIYEKNLKPFLLSL